MQFTVSEFRAQRSQSVPAESLAACHAIKEAHTLVAARDDSEHLSLTALCLLRHHSSASRDSLMAMLTPLPRASPK